MKILRHGWNVRYGNNKSLQNKSNNGEREREKILTTIFKRTMGIYTHIDDIVSRDKQEFVIWRF